MPSTSTLDEHDLPWEARPARSRPRLEVVIAWTLDEPARLGESAAIDGTTTLGRGEPERPEPRVRFRPWRPGPELQGAPLESPRISREQLRLTPIGEHALRVKNVGRNKLLVNGEECVEADVGPGDTLTLRNALVLLVVSREPWAGDVPAAGFPFGVADPGGMVGEGVAAWRLRAELAFAAAGEHHVLLQGPSGVGKELAARAIHARSSRGDRPMVARNAATFPDSLVDAELFGTARNYPNVGSPERPGLVGEADGSTLFLDEIGELPATMQAHLLRVMDRGGEYQRLGDARVRRADIRVVAATNRPLDALKHDFAARFTSRIALPGLDRRREDIPLLLAAMAAQAAAETPSLRARFYEPDGRPRLHPDLVEALLRHRYTLHARELHRLLWRAMATSPGDFVALTPEVRGDLLFPAPPTAAPPDRAAVEAALAAAGGSASGAAEALGLANRYVLYRLMKKYGIGGGE